MEANNTMTQKTIEVSTVTVIINTSSVKISTSRKIELNTDIWI